MTENEIAKIVVDTAYHIHRRLGPGLLESVYEVIPAIADVSEIGGKKVRSSHQFWGFTDKGWYFSGCQ